MGAAGCGSRLPHLYRDSAHPATSAPGLGSPLPHLHRDRVSCAHRGRTALMTLRQWPDVRHGEGLPIVAYPWGHLTSLRARTCTHTSAHTRTSQHGGLWHHAAPPAPTAVSTRGCTPHAQHIAGRMHTAHPNDATVRSPPRAPRPTTCPLPRPEYSRRCAYLSARVRRGLRLQLSARL